MKKLLFVSTAVLGLTISLSLTVAHGQTSIYYPFPDSIATWVNAEYTYTPPFGPPILTSVTNYCMYGSDTIINVNSYSKIHFCGGAYKGATRDVSGKVYFVPKDSLNEFLLYDFTAQQGDSLKVYNEYNPNSAFLADLQAGYVDSVLINGNYRTRINFDVGAWIEGIGSTTGLFAENWVNVSNWIHDLNCMSENDTTLYPTFSTGQCSLTLNLNEDKNNLTYSIFPNPFSTQTTLQTDNLLHSATLTVDNCFGQQVKQIKNISGQTVVLSRDNLPSGLYFVRLTEENKIYTDKLIITD